MGVDSLRAVQPCSEHPGKMWVIRENRLLPILPFDSDEIPWHSSQSAGLPTVWIQNAFIEVSRVANVFERSSLSGTNMLPFPISGPEALDLNTEEDWERGEWYASRNLVRIERPEICDG